MELKVAKLQRFQVARTSNIFEEARADDPAGLATLQL
jgi:hypothetical protein